MDELSFIRVLREIRSHTQRCVDDWENDPDDLEYPAEIMSILNYIDGVFAVLGVVRNER